MTLLTALTWSVARAVMVATIAVLVSRAVTPHRRSKLTVAIALLPLFVPNLLIGFTYRMAASRLAQSGSAASVLTELIYSGILLAGSIAVIIAVRLILRGSSVSNQALHSWKLLRGLTPHAPCKFPPLRRRWWITWFRLQATGPFRASIVGWCAAVLWCFQEFETAALLQVDRHPIAWPVWLFDAHAAGVPLKRSLSMLIVPLVLELTLLCPVVWLLRGSRASLLSNDLPAVSRRVAPSPERASFRLAFRSVLLIVQAVFVVTVFLAWPLISNWTDVTAGFAALWNQPTLLFGSLTQIAASLGFACAASAIAMQAAVVLRSSNRWWLNVAVLVPELLGSLVLSLLLLAVFQSSPANWLYDTWVPIVTGLSLLMLPRAFLLATLLESTVRPQAAHSAKLLLTSNAGEVRRSGLNLVWRLVQFRWLLAGAILVHWSFWDVTVPSLLRPLRFEPVVTRLYNEMHYGRTETLTAITLLSVVLPWTAVFALMFVVRAVLKFRGRDTVRAA
ncbi:MAG: hypothetical protein R3C19_01250 [Planctomycetaceae bacterium]